MNRFKLLFILFFFLFAFAASAQKQDDAQGGKIAGTVIDSASAQAIEYATISLLSQPDNKVVNGTTSDEKGIFKMNGIKDGTYSVVIYFIGYKTITKNNITINKTNSTIVLGDIKLPSNQTVLKEITITTEKNLIEYKIDKMVYNVDKDVTSQTGVASDVLRKIPQVSVDVDGNVELQGNAGIKFLINGKPSVMFGNNIADVLQTIPASQIQSIEVITSPGAKYDAEGTGGIINIILKKNNVEGINGNVSLSGGTRLENGSVNLNVRHKKFGAHAFFSDNAQLVSTTINTLDRTSSDPVLNQTARLLQNGTGDFSRNGFQSGAGFDWDINDKNTISGTVSYNNVEYLNKGFLIRESILQDASGNSLSDVTNSVNTMSNFYMNTLDADLSYKKKFKKEGQELEIIGSSSSDQTHSYYEQQQKYITPDSLFAGSHGDNPGTEKQTNVSVNYTQPLGKDAVLETGGKAEFDQIIGTANVFLLNTASDNYDLNTSQSNSLNYKRNIYAGYISGTFQLFKWLDVKAGGRSEYTSTNAFYSNSGTADIKPYNTLVPSAIISHRFKGENTFKIGYSHRIERPDYRDLNPFVNASDPKNITTGNSALRPEIGDKIEFTYNKFFEKGANINVVLFYRGNKDDIQSFTRYYPTYMIGDSTYTNVAVATRENIGRENNFGINIFGSLHLTSKIELRMNLSGFQRYIINGALPGNNVQGFNYRTNANLTYQVSGSLIIEAFGNFNSPRVNAQGTMPASTTYYFAFRKQLFHKNGSIAVTATNPFNEYQNQRTVLNGVNFSSTALRELPYRSFGINFTYKFGKLEFKKEKEPEDPNLTAPAGG